MEDPGNHDSVHSRSCGSCSSSHSQQGSLQQTQGWKTAAQLSHKHEVTPDSTSTHTGPDRRRGDRHFRQELNRRQNLEIIYHALLEPTFICLRQNTEG